MIRLCIEDDVPAIVAGALGAWETLPLPGKFNPVHFENRLRGLIGAGFGIVFADFDEQGTVTVAAGGALSYEFHTGERMAQQLFWTANVKKKGSAGIRVLREFEKECRRRGAKYLYVTHIFDAQAGRMSSAFKRFGFKPIQATYVKNL